MVFILSQGFTIPYRKRWLEWNSNARPYAYRVRALTTELSG